jgi:hypothetical protein
MQVLHRPVEKHSMEAEEKTKRRNDENVDSHLLTGYSEVNEKPLPTSGLPTIRTERERKRCDAKNNLSSHPSGLGLDMVPTTNRIK